MCIHVEAHISLILQTNKQINKKWSEEEEEVEVEVEVEEEEEEEEEEDDEEEKLCVFFTSIIASN